jgi:arylsulfatase A-like enzyme
MPDVKHLDLYKDRKIPLPETFFDDYVGREAAASQDMRIADMYLSGDMKLHKGYYGTETGTGGNDDFSPDQAWLDTYGRMTPSEKQAWDAHYNPINEEFKNTKPSGRELAEWKYQRYMKDYLRCIVSVDENIGRVLDYLDQKGLTQNTIVVYTSDQGFYLGEHGWYDKRFMYEESLSMPLMIRYPAEIPAGQVRKDLVLNLDFAPTFLDYAGTSIPEDMQGESLRPINRGEAPADWRDSIYYHYYEYPHGWHKVKRHYGIRTDRYKLIHFYNDINTWELYDLEADPNELENLHGNPDYSSMEQTLRNKLEDLRVGFKDESMHQD